MHRVGKDFVSTLEAKQKFPRWCTISSQTVFKADLDVSVWKNWHTKMPRSLVVLWQMLQKIHQVPQKENTRSYGGWGMVSHHHSHQAYVGLQCCLSEPTTEHTNALQNVTSSWQSKILQRFTSALQSHILFFVNVAILLGMLPSSC